MMISVNRDISIDERDIEYRFIRSSGPGGQNVNKVSTAVQLRFNTLGHTGLDARIRERLASAAGKRMTGDGLLIIDASRHRTQERNRRDAQTRLIALLRAAAEEPKHRRPTKPTKASNTRRLESKKKRSTLKSSRRYRPDAE